MKIVISNKEVRTRLETKQKELSKRVRDLEAVKNNPSVSNNYHEAVGALNAIEAVIDLLKGNNVGFNVL